MESISCFIAAASDENLVRTLGELSRCKAATRLFVLGRDLPAEKFCRTETLRLIARQVDTDYVLLYTQSQALQLGDNALERMLQVAVDTGAGLIYADGYRIRDGHAYPHPLIDYQEGSLRDDFDFGSLLLYRAADLKAAAERMDADYQFAGLYDLRLKVAQRSRLIRLPEWLYTECEDDARTSGEKIFDYVDPRNRAAQIEMEAACTQYLKETGAWLKPVFQEVDFDSETFPVEASVVIPVRNREKTIGDAILSALEQKTDFPFNVIVVDNHSTDKTTEIVAALAAKDERLIHLIPQRTDLGIGGCWNAAVQRPECGKFAIQLDSDDLYAHSQAIADIVAAFYEQKTAMVVGAYQMVDFELNEIPPGIVDHREWTPDNGRNNALRINGLGAPRAFYAPVLRKIKLPNTSYGEDYAVGLAISRNYQIGRIYQPLYRCRRWEGNSDSALDIQKANAYNRYKDTIRTIEWLARKKINRS